jgi:hypothetical protein
MHGGTGRCVWNFSRKFKRRVPPFAQMADALASRSGQEVGTFLPSITPTAPLLHCWMKRQRIAQVYDAHHRPLAFKCPCRNTACGHEHTPYPDSFQLAHTTRSLAERVTFDSHHSVCGLRHPPWPPLPVSTLHTVPVLAHGKMHGTLSVECVRVHAECDIAEGKYMCLCVLPFTCVSMCLFGWKCRAPAAKRCIWSAPTQPSSTSLSGMPLQAPCSFRSLARRYPLCRVTRPALVRIYIITDAAGNSTVDILLHTPRESARW